MDVASSAREWSFPFSTAALPRRSLTIVQGIDLSPGPDRMRGMELLESEAGLSPAHRHAHGVAALLCGMPCRAVHALMQATGENPDECAAWVDLGTALARAGRPELAAWALSRTLTPAVSGPDDGGARPARPYPAGSEEEYEAARRLRSLMGLIERQEVERDFLRLRIAAFAEVFEKGEGTPVVEVFMALATALMELGRSLDAAQPYHEAASVLDEALAAHPGAQVLEHLATARMAGGPVAERDRVLAELNRVMPGSRVAREARQPAMADRYFRESEAEYEASLLYTEICQNQQGGQNPVERIHLRFVSSDHPAPYLVAWIRASADSGQLDSARGLSKAALSGSFLSGQDHLVLALEFGKGGVEDETRAHAERALELCEDEGERAVAAELLTRTGGGGS
ncbi:hypothetical protein PUR49_15740 [Streptomyces sp. BE147]|uniref:hypothetical protein n=1 Tax=Streptomyces sp. BE147 TaxID=3002524 RepID=UPI002E786224|nr:hypothetical protein [Streptomyces sp. BE147]MEE1737942.1 hypothetical protein [Streptomyces sp. BE147]